MGRSERRRAAAEARRARRDGPESERRFRVELTPEQIDSFPADPDDWTEEDVERLRGLVAVCA
jgi:hypothetical protein